MVPPRIAILGAGPIGIEAAIDARLRGYDVTLYDRGVAAQNVADWGLVRLFTPWEMNTTPTGRDFLAQTGQELPANRMGDCPTGDEFRRRYLLPLANSPLLKSSLRERTTVISVGRQDLTKAQAIGQEARGASGFRLLLRDARGIERIELAEIVLDCTGTYPNARSAGRGGIAAPGEAAQAGRIWHTLPDPLGSDQNRFAGRHTLLLGSGYSAATFLHQAAALHARDSATRVTWAIARDGAALRPVPNDPLEERRRLTNQVVDWARTPPPWLEVFEQAWLESIAQTPDGMRVVLDGKGGRHELHVDETVALVGYKPDASLYEELQIHQCYATAGPMKLAAALLGEAGGDCLTAGGQLGPDTLENPEPNFFILGAKSYGRNSNFLLQAGHRQVRDVLELVGNKSPKSHRVPKPRAADRP